MKAVPTQAHPAVILGYDYTGLATARCLKAAGVKVYGVSLNKGDIGRWSRCCEVVSLVDDSHLVDKLCQFLHSLPGKPVVIPTSDSMALLLALEAETISEFAYFSSSSHEQLVEIIHKSGLYRLARQAGVGAPAQLNPRDYLQIEEWSARHAPPYLLKPFFQNIEHCPIRTKNQTVATRAALLSLVGEQGFDNLVIQQLRRGGDGNIYDCYGVCDRHGMPISLASHRRLRQWKKDFGATCYGEIPGFPDSEIEQKIFSATKQLLQQCHYHGVFGIEWLHDVENDEYLLIDFNARPFSSIGHLYDCGLNLPLLNYRELAGLSVAEQELTPTLEHKYWVHFSRDIKTLPMRLRERSISPVDWLKSIVRTQSYALWSLKDPLPAVYEALSLLASGARHGAQRLWSQLFNNTGSKQSSR